MQEGDRALVELVEGEWLRGEDGHIRKGKNTVELRSKIPGLIKWRTISCLMNKKKKQLFI